METEEIQLRISTLRSAISKKENTLSLLRGRIRIAKSGRASVSLASRRYEEAIKSSADALHSKRQSAPVVLPTERSAAVSSLLSRWNAGIEKQVEKTKVDVAGNVRGAQKTFSKKDDVSVLPALANPAARPLARMSAPAEIVVEDEESLPSWAVNQRKKVLKKENARSSIRNVDIGGLKGDIVQRGARDVDTEGVKEEVSVGGNVARALAMWGKNADEEAKKLEAKNKIEEEIREAERRERERLEEIRREEERRAEEERQRLEKLRIEEEKKREEEERKRREEEERLRKERELEEIRNLPDEEPTGNELLVPYLEKKIKKLDMLIEDAESELAQLEEKL